MNFDILKTMNENAKKFDLAVAPIMTPEGRIFALETKTSDKIAFFEFGKIRITHFGQNFCDQFFDANEAYENGLFQDLFDTCEDLSAQELKENQCPFCLGDLKSEIDFVEFLREGFVGDVSFATAKAFETKFNDFVQVSIDADTISQGPKKDQHCEYRNHVAITLKSIHAIDFDLVISDLETKIEGLKLQIFDSDGEIADDAAMEFCSELNDLLTIAKTRDENQFLQIAYELNWLNEIEFSLQ